MSNLHQLLVDCESEILKRWTRTLPDAPGSGSGSKDKEHLALFLADLRSSSLATDRGDTAPLFDVPQNDPPSGDLEEAVDPVAAVHAYGALHVLILDLAAERGVPVTASEHRALASVAHAAIARATAAHLRRLSRKVHHVAHQLRNPLSSAIMALTLLTSRVALGSEGRLAETIARNLERLRVLIDDMILRISPDPETQLAARDERSDQG
jgi:signal transduction histidine kinase